MSGSQFFKFIDDNATFISSKAAAIKTIYAPLCGSDASGLKSAISSGLSGDIKIDRFHYVTKPASREDLRHPVRNFYAHIKGKGTFALAGMDAASDSDIVVGQLWHKLTRTDKRSGLSVTALNFIPSSNEPVELMRITVKNISRKTITFTPTAAVPVFCRSLANKHDHEHVTALLNRVSQLPEGVVVEPTMAFNEEGHKEINAVYFVFGADDKKTALAGTFPTVDAFFGDEGNMYAPKAVVEDQKPSKLTPAQMQGKEAVGALRFKDVTLKPGGQKDFIVAIGMASSSLEARTIFGRFNTIARLEEAFKANQKFWSGKTSVIAFDCGDKPFNFWMRWVTLQPVLRRIFGCSFLPDHDYGKGGKGWRDLWQDLLSLILIEPQSVRESLINNFAGIRIDGSNATIIGTKPGEFLADRNAITRVWMDHGSWPFLTTLLYVHQTGDFDLLLHKQTYFRDPQLSRTFEKDISWVAAYGHQLRDKKGNIYEGTILEHLLVQHLTQFFNVGEHNIIRLESADWNDGLDMAFEKGESVAFAALYAGNLLQLADLIENLARTKQIATMRLAKELLLLLDTLGESPVNYDHWQEKKSHLFGTYCHHVQPALSGEYADVSPALIAADLRKKGHWLLNHIRQQEKIQLEHGGETYQWFNGYYDNQSKRVEGKIGGGVRMTLTGQVFTLMSGVADDNESAAKVIASVKRFLKDKALGGYRLNTDFGVRHYLDLGRAFGFAYGTKENGAFFSHMNVMYAYALYVRGFVNEGHEVLDSIYRMSMDTRQSKIYPGIPEYFDSNGQGMYHYLTGSASWLVLTLLTQSFGVRGHWGDLLLHPKLVKTQFDAKGFASIVCQFAGHSINVQYHNPKRLNAGQYAVSAVTIDDQPCALIMQAPDKAVISRAAVSRDVVIKVTLGAIK